MHPAAKDSEIQMPQIIAFQISTHSAKMNKKMTKLLEKNKYKHEYQLYLLLTLTPQQLTTLPSSQMSCQ